MKLWTYSKGNKLLLMGSSGYNAKVLPSRIKERLDDAMRKDVTIIVAEARGSCRLFQDYLASKNYKNVIVGNARTLRYNAGGWRDVKYGDRLKERERNMMADCDFALVIWQNNSGVIAENLKYLKKQGKPAFLYEYDDSTRIAHEGVVDTERDFKIFYPYLKKFKIKEKQSFNKWLSEQKKD
ncbi:MAG: hypothetical protein ACFFA3_13505 [Promethearchaeota archaeon]